MPQFEWWLWQWIPAVQQVTTKSIIVGLLVSLCPNGWDWKIAHFSTVGLNTPGSTPLLLDDVNFFYNIILPSHLLAISSSSIVIEAISLYACFGHGRGNLFLLINDWWCEYHSAIHLCVYQYLWEGHKIKELIVVLRQWKLDMTRVDLCTLQAHASLRMLGTYMYMYLLNLYAMMADWLSTSRKIVQGHLVFKQV